ncbi:DNA repair protein rad16 [Malassezia sp. CBS 17886]|nr:DNA repair protein rad16 [Malassezia sp. CBS 17886]
MRAKKEEESDDDGAGRLDMDGSKNSQSDSDADAYRESEAKAESSDLSDDEASLYGETMSQTASTATGSTGRTTPVSTPTGMTPASATPNQAADTALRAEASADSDTSDTPLADMQRRRSGARAPRAPRAPRARGAKKAAEPKLSRYQRSTAELLAHHPELGAVWTNLEHGQREGPAPRAAQPAGITIQLLPFQLEGLHWLQAQERSIWRGGLLADEMGMGKTIQMVSLLVSDPQRPNLVVAPTVAILQWRNEIHKYAQGLNVIVWHGAQRTQDRQALEQADVVLTSYAVMESAYRKAHYGLQRGGRRVSVPSALHAIHWRRAILDEAHHIKERATNTARSAFALQCDLHWCLSGTPLQNRVGELYSMVRFLGGDPFSYYYCRKCPCKALRWSFSDRRHCDHCGHKPMVHLSFWNFTILRPIQRDGTSEGDGRDAFAHLRLLLDNVMLRRTKLERADDMGLPPRTVMVRRDNFNAEEEDLYQSLYSTTTRNFSTYLDQGTVLNNYSNIFTLLTRMRQMANHPDLVLRSKTGTKAGLLGDELGDEVNVCRLCTEEAEDAVMSRCRHVFCRACIRQYIESVEGDGDEALRAHDSAAGGAPDCPYCHAMLSVDLEAPALETPQQVAAPGDPKRQGILSRVDLANWRSSTKIEALVEELTKLRELPDKSIKSLVFSQFVNFLDLIAFRLQRAGFRICRLEGNMTPEARDRTIRLFMDNPGITVFLVSLKAGGVALNLTEASRVYIMDPWWNPAVEVQAMDRIHRLGQHRPIVVKRMIIENSIESRIIELQNKKSAMIEAAIGNDDGAMGRLSVDDLRFLFTL